MREFRRLVLPVLAAVAICTGTAVGAEQRNVAKAPAGERSPAYLRVERSLPGARLHSVLRNPRAALNNKPGTGWVLHYGTAGDGCSRADATSGLRITCISW